MIQIDLQAGSKMLGRKHKPAWAFKQKVRCLHPFTDLSIGVSVLIS